LTLDELAEWIALAPVAQKAGTLIPATMLHLVDLCKSRVLLAKLLGDVYRDGTVVIGAGGNQVAHPSVTKYTTLIGKVDKYMTAFKLAPIGKEMVEPEKPSDPFAEFDDAPAATAGEKTH
jgi:hypothetical protein